MSEKKVSVALVGFGTIGSGVVKLIQQNRNFIKRRTGIDLNLKYVIDKDLERPRPVKVETAEMSRDYRVALRDRDVSIVVELVGGTTFAHKLVMESIDAGKHVVTANKALLAEKGEEIFRKAREKDRVVMFEASVGGGIPIIRTLTDALIADRISSIYGIVNGTTNYILTRMLEDGLGFDEALREAQVSGFAEADPSLDIDGHDAAHKIAILSSLAFNTPVSYSDVCVEGISGMDLRDVRYAEELGFVVKLLAITKLGEDEKVEVRVHPTLIPKSSQLAAVRNEYNAVLVESEFLGTSMYYGKGAGSHPTATAVVADIVTLAKIVAFNEPPIPKVSFHNSFGVKPIDETVNRYYLRFTTIDKPGILSKISGVLGEHKISIASVIQKESPTDIVPLVMTTHEAEEGCVKKALKVIDSLDIIKAKTVVLRIAEV